MLQYNYSNLKEFLNGWTSNEKYFNMLRTMAQLSKLFSTSETPYIDYRLAENLFCRYYSAKNDARSCTAYDARINSIGIGIKTFTITGDSSVEKIAEFNQLRPALQELNGLELARKLGEFRNDRMQLANDVFDVTETLYHIVGRKPNLLRVFNTPYEKVRIDQITDVVDTVTSIKFNDGVNEYSFNKSKSVLQKRFFVPCDYTDIPVDILDDPLSLLDGLINGVQDHNIVLRSTMVKGVNFVVLPLYSTRDKQVQQRAGLNQWNANGRERDQDEVYIPVPASIHRLYPHFFPQNNIQSFILMLPDGSELSAKMCQSGLKGLMSNPNKALGRWILRKVLKKAPGELVTMDDLNRYGIDSVCVEKLQPREDGTWTYRISFSDNYENYERFIG